MSLLHPNLEAFYAIVQETTVHGAARSLNLTQTAVTQRIRALERELKVTLFLRSRMGMKLTPEGQKLLQFYQVALEAESKCLSELKTSDHSKIFLTLAGPTSYLSSRVIKMIPDLKNLHPELTLHLSFNDEDQLIPLLKNGKADLAVIPLSQVPNELEGKKLRPQKYVLVATSDWKGRRMQKILEEESMIDFHEDDQTTQNFLRLHGLLHLVKKPRLFANNNQALMELLKNGMGYGTLTKEVADPALQSGELIIIGKDYVLEEELALVWWPRSQMPAYLKNLIKSLI